ncbi:fimbrial protein [Serratia sp. UGAL515B_01]|uniref:fimbrial protein n=1 Tax=Serratia sp. UGAL515B_01 TaxID=2986763 RepID=UPI002954ADAE|nr:fimbrial protein [Serratia sp. UGAL515B_01]WON77499.1 type 1 fimbrial protein [Serratia sp. UGAL515B_01]WON77502.1 type 1 fimbrial protein [Serratia sp. UGAL515B_01]
MLKIQHVVCALAMAVSVGANAVSSGTVTFNGELVADTCTISSDSINKIVQLPKIPTQDLNVAGAEQGSREFQLNVEACPASITQVAAHFNAIGGSAFDPTTGNLVNASTAATPAKQVQVRLYNVDGKQIRVGSTGEFFNVVNQKATMTYVGGYYATGVTTPGPVTSVASYVLAYP